jgi:Na+/proline symporter
MLTPYEGFWLAIGYAIAMTIIVVIARAKHRDAEDFLVVNRQLGLFRGAFSIAAAWIWAPAIFICSLKSFTQGLPGIFWFTFPNILCFFTFTPLALRLRKLLPNGYTLPDFVWARYDGDRRAHLAFLVVYLGYQLGAIIINTLAGGTLLHILTGLNFQIAVLLISATSLTYSLISGLRASVLTDVIQMIVFLVIGFLIVPWVISVVGGTTVLAHGLGGESGQFRDIFNPTVAFSFGIPVTLGLISGPISDQMFFQRVFAAKRKSIAGIFIIGGLVFGIVPIILSLLGFVAAAPEIRSQLTVTDPQMIGPLVVGHFLPKWALMAFCLMAIGGLCSTLDSAYCAISSLGSIDVYRRYFNPRASDRQILNAARWTMVIAGIMGTLVALLQPQLIWMFLIYGALASAGLFPTIFSLFSSRVTASTMFWAVLLSIGIGTPLSIYANFSGNNNLVVSAAILSVTIGLVICLISVLLNKRHFDFSSLATKIPDLNEQHAL